MITLTNENNTAEQRIYDWIKEQEEKDECLKTKLETKEVTSAELLAYCCKEAKKQANGGSACICDATVFEWCKHYILEDLKATVAPKAKVKVSDKEEVTKKETKQEVKPKKEVKKPVEEESLFNLFGDADLTGSKTDLF